MMKKSKIQIFVVVTFLLVAGLIFGFVQKDKLPEQDLKQLSSLNEKYGLIDVAPIDERIASKNYPALFEADILKADLFDGDTINLAPQELILKLENEKNPQNMENLFLLSFKTEEKVETIVEDYTKAGLVEYAEPNFDIELAETVISETTEEPPVEEKSTNLEKPVKVAVIDSGIDTSHDFFKDKLLSGWDFVEETSVVSDEVGHGTHVAGIVLSNSISAKIMPIKFTNGKKGKMSALIKSIKFAADNGSQIINLSLGLKTDSKVLDEAISYAQNKNIIIVAAAGNYNTDAKYYPAAAPDVIAVAALDKKDQKLYQSNYGSWVDFSALGQDIYSTSLNNNYTYRTGTSQAAPFVTAKLVDLISIADEDYKISDIISQLKENSEPIDDNLLGRKVL